MGWLNGDIRALFNGAFAGQYLDATLHQGTGDPIYSGGTITGYTGAGDQACKAQIDAADYAMTRERGYEEGDVAIIILAAGLARITSDMEVTVDRAIADLPEPVRYSIQSARLDAAASHWRCRGREIRGS